jgi:hypothetical protein
MADASNPGRANGSIDWLPSNAPEPTSAKSSGAWLFLSVTWSLFGVSAVILALRLYTAARILRRVKLEDYLMLSALVGLYEAFEYIL